MEVFIFVYYWYWCLLNPAEQAPQPGISLGECYSIIVINKAMLLVAFAITNQHAFFSASMFLHNEAKISFV